MLPDEMRELRRLEGALADAFERFGYGEVATPTIEYHEVLARGDERGAPAAYRFFDEGGELLAMRSDMTIPIARLVGDPVRRRRAAVPLLLHRQRLPRGPPAARADARVRPGRRRADRGRRAGGHGRGDRGPERGARRGRADPGGDRPRRRRPLPPAPRRAGGRGRSPRARSSSCSRRTTSSGSRRRSTSSRSATASARRCCAFRTCAAAPRSLERARELGGEAVERATERLAATFEALAARGVAERVSLDLGLLRDLGYYTGAILEVYDPALGHVLGGGGRYDELMGRFGRPLPAAGFALYLERVHIAQAEEERLAQEASVVRLAGRRKRPGARAGGPLKLAVPRGALFDGNARSARPDRHRHRASCAAIRARWCSKPTGWCWSRCARRTCPPTSRPGAADLGHHRQGRAARAARPGRVRAPRPRLRGLPDGARRPPGRREPRRGGAAPGRDADRDQVPAHGRAATSRRRAARPR